MIIGGSTLGSRGPGDRRLPASEALRCVRSRGRVGGGTVRLHRIEGRLLPQPFFLFVAKPSPLGPETRTGRSKFTAVILW